MNYFLDPEDFWPSSISESHLYNACDDLRLVVRQYGYEYEGEWYRSTAIIQRKDGLALRIILRTSNGGYFWELLPSVAGKPGEFGYPEGEADTLEEALDVLVEFEAINLWGKK